MACLQCKDSKIKPKITCHGSEASIAFNCGCKFDVRIDGGPVKVITKHANLGNAQSIEWRTHNCKPCKQKEAAWQTLETGCTPPYPPAGQLIKQECAGSSLKQYFTDGQGGQTVTTIPFVVNFSATVSGCNDVDLAWNNIDGASFILKRNGQPLSLTKDEDLANGTYTYTLDVTTKEGCTFSETASATIAQGQLALRVVGACQNVTLSWGATSGPYTLLRDSTLVYSGDALTTSDNDLPNGSYTYTLTDGCGQTSNGTASVNKPNNENSTFTATVSNCNNINFAWTSIPNTKFFLFRDGTQIYSGYDHSFSDNNKADGTYVYRLKIALDWQDSPCFTELYQTVVVYKPAIVLTAIASNCTVTLTATAINGATYTFKRGTTTLSCNGFTCADTGLANGTYAYTVTATMGTCNVSATASATVVKPIVYLSTSILCKNVTLLATAITGASYVFKRGTTVLASSGNTCTDNGLANGNYSYSVAVSVGTCAPITATASASINVTAYGVLLIQGACVGSYRTNTYANGNCGSYVSQVQDCAGCCTPAGVLISQGACNGNSRTNIYSNGCCGQYSQVVQDCAGCCPPAGLISWRCSGTTRIESYRDGCCGTYESSIANSPSCTNWISRQTRCKVATPPNYEIVWDHTLAGVGEVREIEYQYSLGTTSQNCANIYNGTAFPATLRWITYGGYEYLDSVTIRVTVRFTDNTPAAYYRVGIRYKLG